MEECDICLTKIKKPKKNKHQQSKKHKYFLSNLIINKYIVRNNEIDKFKDILQSYYDKHKKKFDYVDVLIICKRGNETVREIQIPNKVIIEKRYDIPGDINRMPVKLIRSTIPHDNNGPIIWTGSCVDYLDNYYNFDNDFCDEINIIFISDLKDITFFHYMEQPRSMLFKKLEKNFIKEEDFEDFDYNWIPNCFKHFKENK